MEAAAAYPPPPQYYRLYGKEGEAAAPPEPPPPVSGDFTCFFFQCNAEDRLPGLEEQGIRQLYPKDVHLDVKSELRRLGRELGLLALELVDALVDRPSTYARRVEDMSLVFKNIHHLLNELRPQQARLTIMHILKMQLEVRKKELVSVKRQLADARELLGSAVAELKEAEQRTGSPLLEAAGAAAGKALAKPCLREETHVARSAGAGDKDTCNGVGETHVDENLVPHNGIATVELKTC